jgi:[protein-PII] uridylyltransferase
VTTTPSERTSGPDHRSRERKEQRRALLAAAPWRGGDLARALADQVDSWIVEDAEVLPVGWAVAAAAGYERSEICPGSDVDVVLLHPDGADDALVRAVAQQLWYPLWDSGIALSAATHSARSALQLGGSELATATSLLRLRPVAGDAALVLGVARDARRQWAERAEHWLRMLGASVAERHERAGEVAFLLEPDLKEGRGGLRDVHALAWARQTGHRSVAGADEQPIADLIGPARLLLDVRVELHRTTGRRSDRLALQEQDAVAAALGIGDADELMRSVSQAARTIAWSSDRFWARVLGRLGPTRRRSLLRRRPDATPTPVTHRPLAAGVAVRIRPSGDEVVITDDAPLDDPTLILRTAAAAAGADLPLARSTLKRLAAGAVGPGDPWTATARNDLVALLGSGPPALAVFEALDRYGLLTRILPEWDQVRARPQRNPLHRYTVDWHLCQAALRANDLVRKVTRPDLLLVGCWLHDIGKGFPGDHVVVGAAIVERIARRMGFDRADVETLVALEQHHLLLPTVATRRDISDPRTIESVVEVVRDPETLALLRALSAAERLATGPAAGNDSKRLLLDQLTHATAAVLAGAPAPAADRRPSSDDLALVHEARRSGTARLRAAADRVTIAAPDRTGLFALVAGVLSLHGLEVVSGEVRTTDDGVALDRFQVAARFGGDPDWGRIAADVQAAYTGQLDLAERLARRERSWDRQRRSEGARPAQPEVFVDPDGSASATVVEVRAPDGPGVLHRLAGALSEAGFDIRAARVTTLGHDVVDVFYVVRPDPDGGPGRRLTDRASLDAVRRTLLDALA